MLLSALLVPLAVSAVILEPRQTTGSKLVGTDKLEPKIRKTAQRQLVKYGPFKLKAANGGGLDSTLMGQSFMMNIKEGLCNQKGQACTVLAGKVGLMYTDGKPADPSNGIYIHHILSSDTAKKQNPWLSTCGRPTSPGMSINGITGGTGFISAGEDSSDGGVMYTNDDGSQNSGYHIGPKDTFNVWAQIVNYNKVAKDVYITYDLEWVPGIQGDDVKTMLLSVTSCSSMIKLSESGPTNTTSGKFYFMEDGKVFRARGHLHDGGVQMDLFINDKYKCSSKATYGTRSASDGGMGGHSHGTQEKDGSVKTISGMSNCWGPWPVKKGDYLTGVAEYDLKKHPLRKTGNGGKASDVMGLWTISFTADKK
jgi:hypothetical protein